VVLKASIKSSCSRFAFLSAAAVASIYREAVKPQAASHFGVRSRFFFLIYVVYHLINLRVRQACLMDKEMVMNVLMLLTCMIIC
jgi:hypothetical protein